jgi:flagellar hook assembly protein FlgD
MAGETAIPLVTQLGFARPNPAKGAVSLTVDLASERPAHIEVYDLRGARVRTLMQGVQPAGRYVLTWDGKDGAGHPAAKGIYIVRMESADYVATRKVLMTR